MPGALSGSKQRADQAKTCFLGGFSQKLLEAFLHPAGVSSERIFCVILNNNLINNNLILDDTVEEELQ